MNSDKKLYLYSGLAIAISLAIYVVATKRSKTNTDPINDKKDDVQTSTGDTISVIQATIDPILKEILKLPIVQIKKNLLKKEVYSKVENINPRQQPYVNNGWFVNNGVGGRITDKDTLLGVITDVVKDKGLLKNKEGVVYKWFKIKPSAEAIRQIKDDSNFLIPTKTDSFYIREDVVKMQK